MTFARVKKLEHVPVRCAVPRTGCAAALSRALLAEADATILADVGSSTRRWRTLTELRTSDIIPVETLKTQGSRLGGRHGARQGQPCTHSIPGRADSQL
jgi:hypothetical protein